MSDVLPTTFDKEAFAARMKRAMGEKGNSWICDRVSFSDSTLRSYLKGEVEPTLSNLMSFCQATGANFTWLVTGDESATANEKEAQLVSLTEDELAYQLGYISKKPVGHETATKFVLTQDRSYFALGGRDPDLCRLLTITSDTNAPKLKPGDHCLVDIRKQPLTQGYFLLAVQGSAIIRVVSPTIRGYMAMPVNSTYPGFTLTVDAEFYPTDPGVSIIGRLFNHFEVTPL
ncbi:MULTISPECIES: hypothetical protein [Pseudomonas]|jgi:transcriptional regulator with XRE-family HTH domain|uniref:HTH cro/C1-type domain-containing protein n=1 Tax=Pseudomonas fluorescens (strain SBW25) TaxID=216595 RepID=A0A0G4E5S3_PSEFS|nr:MULTISPECIES: hypothetical protein [Pseudomonas]OEC66345.1 hypothetical protein A7D21_28985 [Pseudomonas sp. AP19]CEK42494.1 hypothetical protein PQBR55_0115 [Pseudomonas fluorescens SBW25]